MKRPLVTNVSESSGGRPSSLLEGLDKREILRTDRQMRGLDQEEAGAQAVMRQNPGGNPPQATRYRLQTLQRLSQKRSAVKIRRSSQASRHIHQTQLLLWEPEEAISFSVGIREAALYINLNLGGVVNRDVCHPYQAKTPLNFGVTPYPACNQSESRRTWVLFIYYCLHILRYSDQG